MIESIELNHDLLAKNNSFEFLTKLKFFQENRKIKFSDNVNIIFSPNGAGKSTLLKLIALSLAAEQGGVSKITNAWIQNLFRRHHFNNQIINILDGVSVLHDGQKLNYLDSRKEVGLTFNRDIDNDFYETGLIEIIDKQSAGYKTIHRTKKMFDLMENYEHHNFDFKSECAMKLEDYVEEQLKPKIEKGKPTILLDEPESGLSPIFQGNFFSGLAEYKNFDKYQWIIATHSPFVFMLPNVKIINLTDDETYTQNTINAFRIMLKSIDEKNMF